MRRAMPASSRALSGCASTSMPGSVSSSSPALANSCSVSRRLLRPPRPPPNPPPRTPAAQQLPRPQAPLAPLPHALQRALLQLGGPFRLVEHGPVEAPRAQGHPFCQYLLHPVVRAQVVHHRAPVPLPISSEE